MTFPVLLGIMFTPCGGSDGTEDIQKGAIIPVVTLKSGGFTAVRYYSAVYQARFEVDIEHTVKESGVYIKAANDLTGTWTAVKTPTETAAYETTIYAVMDGSLKSDTEYSVKPYVIVSYTDGEGHKKEHTFEGDAVSLKTLRCGTAKDLAILSARKYTHPTLGQVLDIVAYAEFELLPEEVFESLTIQLKAPTETGGTTYTLVEIKAENTGLYTKQGNTYKCTHTFRYRNNIYDQSWFNQTPANVIMGHYGVAVHTGSDSYSLAGGDISFRITSEI